MMSLLTVEGRMGVTEPGKALERKLAVRTLGFLKADHIRSRGFDEFCHEVDAQADRIDVPGRDLQSRDLQIHAGCWRPHGSMSARLLLKPESVVDRKQARVRLLRDVEIVDRNRGLVALRIGHRPL